VLTIKMWNEGTITKTEEERGDKDDCQRTNMCHEKERDDTSTKDNLLGGRSLQTQPGGNWTNDNVVPPPDQRRDGINHSTPQVPPSFFYPQPLDQRSQEQECCQTPSMQS